MPKRNPGINAERKLGQLQHTVRVPSALRLGGLVCMRWLQLNAGIHGSVRAKDVAQVLVDSDVVLQQVAALQSRGPVSACGANLQFRPHGAQHNRQGESGR